MLMRSLPWMVFAALLLGLGIVGYNIMHMEDKRDIGQQLGEAARSLPAPDPHKHSDHASYNTKGPHF